VTRVLVADAEKFWRETTQAILEEKGYQVDALDDYADLRKALSKNPDIILLGFPIIGPHEADIVQSTLEACPKSVILVFSTSWLITQSTRRQLMKLGVADVGGRPGNSDELIRLIEQELAIKNDELGSLSSYARFRLFGAD